MMPSDFISLDGSIKLFDLDNVYEVVRGFSQIREGWTSLLVFEPTHYAFIELRSSPPDVRGNSKDEAAEMQTDCIKNFYNLNEADINTIRSKPKEWRLIDRRSL